jgi:hypothetical protein
MYSSKKLKNKRVEQVLHWGREEVAGKEVGGGIRCE